MSLVGLSCRAVQQLWHICSRSCLDFSVRQNELKTESRGQTWDLVYHKNFLGYGSWPWEQIQRLSQSPPLTRRETTHWMEFTQARQSEEIFGPCSLGRKKKFIQCQKQHRQEGVWVVSKEEVKMNPQRVASLIYRIKSRWGRRESGTEEIWALGVGGGAPVES